MARVVAASAPRDVRTCPGALSRAGLGSGGPGLAGEGSCSDITDTFARQKSG